MLSSEATAEPSSSLTDAATTAPLPLRREVPKAGGAWAGSRAKGRRAGAAAGGPPPLFLK